ncbi:MAG: hypothetical protein EXS08_15700 [Planctomycetes bacterium]|nr:hypothetical protein [Planctomycetota bacterium]
MVADFSSVLAPISLAGGLGQACFFSRFFVQWWASERAKRPVVPSTFWWLSLVGSVLMLVYTLVKEASGAGASAGDYALLLPSYLVGGVIAARNLWLTRANAQRLDPRLAAAVGCLCLLLLVLAERGKLVAFEQPRPWLLLGALGQLLWMARFPLQWWLSEKKGISHFPPSFWWVSLAGNLLLLAYTLHVGDVLLIASYVPGPLVQVRNLMLGRAARAE